jgi:hypothetical protein
MKSRIRIAAVALTALVALASLRAADVKVDLSKEKVGAEPTTFLPMVGGWVVVQDGPDKAIQVDGTQWKADLKSQPARSLAENARAIYGAEHEAFLDKVKAFAYYPVAYLKGVDNFTGGAITTKFKTVGGTLDTCSGILFNGKVNGDYLTVRHNGKDRDVRLWIFHDGVRTLVKRGERMDIPVGEWHELKVTVAGADIKGYMDGKLVLEHTWTEPISGKVGLWSKTDSISNFKDYEISSK